MGCDGSLGGAAREASGGSGDGAWCCLLQQGQSRDAEPPACHGLLVVSLVKSTWSKAELS